MKKISVLIPTIRPQNIPKLVKMIQEYSGLPSNLVEIISLEDRDREGCPKTLKRLVSMATHSIVVFIGDDCEPTPNFLLEAWRVLKKFPDKVGLVGLNDQFHDGDKLATHWMAHKKLLRKLDGEFFHTGYRHTWCDVELTERCKQMGRYRFAPRAIIQHNHPIVQNRPELVDADYARVYSDEYRRHDAELFQARKANGWKTPAKVTPQPKRFVAIGIPAAGQGKAKFWMRLEDLIFYSARRGINVVRRRRMGAVVSHNRNKIVADVLEKDPGASHILFIDDDMTFPPDLLERLLAHDKDMVVANAHRKYPPYVPVVSVDVGGGDYFHPIYVRPEHGTLERVTSAGTGVCLIKTDVFRKVPFPWFQAEYLPPDPGHEKDPGLIMGHLFVSEDNRFFIQAQSCGFKLYCDFSLEIGHIAEYEVTWRDHERAMEDGKRNAGDHADAGAGDRGNGDQHHDQPGAPGRRQEVAGNAQLPFHGGLDHPDGCGRGYDVHPAH